MRYAIISDLHANIVALDAVLKDAESQGVQAIVCLGDVVGYGPEPRSTLRRINRVAVETLAGNHDDAVTGRAGADDFIGLAADAVKRHRAALDPEELLWLKSRAYTSCAIEGAIAVHGDFTNPAAFNYIETEEQAKANFDCTDAQLMFVGHTHVPCIFLVGGSGRVYKTGPQDFTLEDGKRYIVNPGSVGYPREADGKCMSSYVIWDSVERTVCFRFIAFSVASVMQRGFESRWRRMRWPVLSALALAALAAAAAMFAMRNQDDEVVISQKEVLLSQAFPYAAANLELEKDSPAALLDISYRNWNGRLQPAKAITVRKSHSGRYPPPAKTAEVEAVVFALKPFERGKMPKIKTFSPQPSEKKPSK